MTYNDIVAALPSLSPRELHQLSTAIKPLLQLKGKDVEAHHLGALDPSIDDNASGTVLLLDVLIRVCPVPGFHSHTQLVRLGGYSAFSDCAADLVAFVDSVATDHIQRRVFVALCWELLRKNLADMGLPVGYSMLLKHSRRIPEIIDHHFPGYASSGLMRYIVRRRSNNG